LCGSFSAGWQRAGPLPVSLCAPWGYRSWIPRAQTTTSAAIAAWRLFVWCNTCALEFLWAEVAEVAQDQQCRHGVVERGVLLLLLDAEEGAGLAQLRGLLLAVRGAGIHDLAAALHGAEVSGSEVAVFEADVPHLGAQHLQVVEQALPNLNYLLALL